MPHLPNLSEEDKAWTARLRTLHPQGLPEPQPFFFTRLQARLAVQQPQPPILPAWLRRPAYAFFLGTLVLALNADTALCEPGSPPTSACSTSSRK